MIGYELYGQPIAEEIPQPKKIAARMVEQGRLELHDATITEVGMLIVPSVEVDNMTNATTQSALWTVERDAGEPHREVLRTFLAATKRHYQSLFPNKKARELSHYGQIARAHEEDTWCREVMLRQTEKGRAYYASLGRMALEFAVGKFAPGIYLDHATEVATRNHRIVRPETGRIICADRHALVRSSQLIEDRGFPHVILSAAYDTSDAVQK